jgi:DNA-binding transcriptional LysR family regulator
VRQGEQGLLKVGFVGSASYSMMPHIIRQFRRRYPRVDLVIEESTTVELLRRVESHTLDVALVRFPVLVPTEAELSLLQKDVMVLAVPADSALADRKSIPLRDAADEPFIVYSRTMVPTMYALTMHAFNEAGIHPRIAQEAVQVQTLLSLVECGLGVALVPSQAARYAGDNVRLLALDDVPGTMNVAIALATLPDALTPAARRFIALSRTRRWPRGAWRPDGLIGARHSTGMFAALTISRVASISLTWKSRNCAGVPVNKMPPRLLMNAAPSGLFIALRTSADSLSTILAGVLAGAKIPVHA